MTIKPNRRFHLANVVLLCLPLVSVAEEQRPCLDSSPYETRVIRVGGGKTTVPYRTFVYAALHR